MKQKTEFNTDGKLELSMIMVKNGPQVSGKSLGIEASAGTKLIFLLINWHLLIETYLQITLILFSLIQIDVF